MASPKHYDITMRSVFQWAQHELAHVGRIAAVEDKDIQYSYALSTVNGMAHLKDALYQLAKETRQADKKRDIYTLHAQVIRVMKHLIHEYKIDVAPIKAFNVRGVLSDLRYLKNSGTRRVIKGRGKRKGKGTRKH